MSPCTRRLSALKIFIMKSMSILQLYLRATKMTMMMELTTMFQLLENCIFIYSY
ncbi:hypothetical protein CDL12_06116 [Handroanthus impetiginosus]|uniref:Uncharacterized protein n=1 Tax=Handroanthus impetiginosus TaxID=429701 RepID=A0A2G9HUK0_9LAMI|nr:hypothetical protein CDL12_06116 [Handroanthus impetiginosus]